MINENIRKIREAIEKNKLVVFVGAGVSLNSELPGWGQLICEFCKVLNIDSTNLSTEDYLKIPQYYFNQRGFKEYYDFIHNIIGVKAEPNKIHDLILEMSPAHIVTTNYDDLIEKATENQLLFYDVVSENNDLPYTPNGRMIIKMHGDLNKKNIVLKEDDYLQYSVNFSMVETFVKSLFVNHTVLFIGYSLNDYDLKLIISNLRSILGEHYQKAYLIDSSEGKDEYSKNYISSLGVNIIDINQIKIINPKEYTTLKKEEGKRLARIIDYILCDDGGYSSIIEKYYDKLKELNDLEYCLIRNLTEKIDIKGHIRIKNGVLCIFNDSEMQELIIELKQITEKSSIYDKYKVIRDVFLKCGIRKLEVHGNAEYQVEFEYVLCNANSVFQEYIENNNYMEILPIAEKVYKNSADNMYLNQMVRAFCNYNIGRYVTAYDILNNISNKAFRNKNYIYYYICEYNMKQLIRLFENVGHVVIKESVYVEHLNKIKEGHRKKVDTSLDAYCMLSKIERKKIEHLKDIILDTSFLSRELSTMIDLADKVKKATMTSYVGGGEADINEVYEITSKAKEIWNYIYGNTLMVSHYSEVISFYKYYAQGLLETYNKNKYKCLNYEDDFFKELRRTVISDYKFTCFDLSVISKFLKPDDLLELFKAKNVEKIYLNTYSNMAEDEFILPLLFNAIQSHINVEHFFGRDNIVNNLFVFAAHIELGEKFFAEITEVIIKLIKSDKINKNIYKFIQYFISKQSNNEYVEKFALECVSSLIEKIATSNRRLDDHYYNPEMSAIDIYFIPNILHFIKCKSLGTNEENLLKILIEIDNGILKEHNSIFVNKLMIPLLKYISEESKSKILNYIKLDKNMSDDRTYIILCNNQIIEHSIEYENKLYNQIESDIKNRNPNQKFYPDPIEIKLNYLANLKYTNKLIDIDRAKKYKGEYDYYDFFIDPKEFDYENKLNIDWLIDIKEEFLIKEVLSNEKAYTAIENKFKTFILENEEVEKSIKKFYFKYLTKNISE